MRRNRRGELCSPAKDCEAAVGARSVCSAPKVMRTAKRRGSAERLLRSEGYADCEAISPPWRGVRLRLWRKRTGWFAEWGSRQT